MTKKEISRLKRSHARLLRGCQESLQWIAKVAADQDEGDPTGMAIKAMRYHGDVEFAISNAYQWKDGPTECDCNENSYCAICNTLVGELAGACKTMLRLAEGEDLDVPFSGEIEELREVIAKAKKYDV